MRKSTGPIISVVMIAFAAWCVFALRADLARMSLAPVLHSWDVVLFAVVLSVVNYALRIVRWRWYMRRLGRPLTPTFAILTYVAGFAFTLSPGKLGEVARGKYYTDVGIPMSEVAGAFFVERLMDLIAMLILATLVLTAFPAFSNAIWYAAGLTVVGLAVLAAIPWEAAGRHFGSAVLGSPATAGLSRPAELLARAAGGAVRTVSAARVLLRPGAVLVGFALALVAWGLEGLGLYVLSSLIVPAHVDPVVGTGIYAVSVLLGALTFLPGGLGSTEAVMTTLLSLRGYSLGDALLITIVCRLVTLWLAVGLGWLAVLVLRNRPVPVVTL